MNATEITIKITTPGTVSTSGGETSVVMSTAPEPAASEEMYAGTGQIESELPMPQAEFDEFTNVAEMDAPEPMTELSSPEIGLQEDITVVPSPMPIEELDALADNGGSKTQVKRGKK